MGTRTIAGICTALGVILLTAASGTAALAPIKLDLDGSGGPTQSGWVGLNGGDRYSNGSQLDGVADGLPAGVQAGFGTGTNERNRTPSDNNMPGAGATRGFLDGIDYTSLLRDYVSLDGDAASPSLIIKGLPAGPYTVSITGGDPDWGSQHAPYDVGVNGTDTSHPGYPAVAGGGSVAQIDSITTLAANPNHPTEWSITIDVAVTLNGTEDLNLYRGTGVTGTDQVRLAGVQIVQIPEPATMGLMALGFAGLAALRRRRR